MAHLRFVALACGVKAFVEYGACVASNFDDGCQCFWGMKLIF
jgi:hypothetical protein